MQAGISTASLFSRYDTESALFKIRSMGVTAAEVFFSTFYEYRPEFSKSIADRLEGIAVNSVHVNSTNFEPNLFNPSRRVRGDGFYWLDQIARSARLLKCGNYTFHGFHRLSSVHTDVDGFAGYLGDAVEFLSGYGVRLCLENVSWCTYHRPGIFRLLKERIPGLSGVLDMKQARRSGFPWQMYVKDMAGSIAYVHLSDVDADGRMCLPGRGITDFYEVLRTLRDTGFDGALMIEVYSGDYGEERELGQSYEYLSEMIYKLS